MNKDNFGVITEQGFVAGQFGFNELELSKEDHEKLKKSIYLEDEKGQSSDTSNKP